MTKQERKSLVDWVFNFIHDGLILTIMMAIFFIGVCLV